MSSGIARFWKAHPLPSGVPPGFQRGETSGPDRRLAPVQSTRRAGGRRDSRQLIDGERAGSAR